MKTVIFAWRDTAHPKAGGSEVVIHEVAKRLVAAGHAVTVITARKGAGKTLNRRDNIDGIRIIRAGGRFTVYLKAPWIYWFKHRRSSEAVLDVENGIPFFTPLYVRRPVVCLVHHVHKDILLTEMRFPLNRIGYFLETRLFPYVYRNKKLIAVSKKTKEDLVKIGFQDNLIRVIYDGLDHDVYSPDENKAPDPLIVYMGRIQGYKQVDQLIEIFDRVKARVSTARLIIAGSGDAIAEVERAADLSTYRNDIDFTGYVNRDEKIRLLREGWVFANPSRMEGWGLGVLEANACGTPAVAYRVPGLSESIIDGQTGFLADSREELSEQLTRILKDAPLRERLSKNATEFAARFDWARTTSEYLETLKGAVDGND